MKNSSLTLVTWHLKYIELRNIKKITLFAKVEVITAYKKKICRPVSVPPIVSKIFERITQKQIRVISVIVNIFSG